LRHPSHGEHPRHRVDLHIQQIHNQLSNRSASEVQTDETCHQDHEVEHHGVYDLFGDRSEPKSIHKASDGNSSKLTITGGQAAMGGRADGLLPVR